MSVGKRIFLPRGFIEEIIANSQKATNPRDYAHRSGYIMCAGRNGRQYAFEVRPGTIDNSWIARNVARKNPVIRTNKKERDSIRKDVEKDLLSISDPAMKKVYMNIFSPFLIDTCPVKEQWFKFFVIPYTTGPVDFENDAVKDLLLNRDEFISNYLRILSSTDIHLYSLQSFSSSKEVPVKYAIKLYDNSFLLNLDWTPTFEQKRFLKEKNKSYHVLVENASKSLGLWHDTLRCLATDNEVEPAMNPNDLTLLLEL